MSHDNALDLLDASAPGAKGRPRMTVTSKPGHKIEVPAGCPIHEDWIEHAQLDWADGWYIYLRNKRIVREQPGPKAPHVQHSEGYLYLKPGWHVLSEDGAVLMSQEDDSPGYPSAKTLAVLWRRYMDGDEAI